jgi:peptide/nickel transport system substrate-binding protein
VNDEIKNKIKNILPSKRELLMAITSFRKNERVIFHLLMAVAVISILVLVKDASRLFMEEKPTYGGAFTEGIVGTPRFVNPILAISDADRDAAMLVYSGLIRKTEDGGFIPDLAEKYEISRDGLTYIFTLRDNIFFQDDTPITTDDVEFTIQKAKDPLIKSPKRPNWEGVSVQKIDEKTISFTLKHPYAQFLENATMGILPKNLWKDIPVEQFSFSDYNLNGIGSGPYKVDSVTKSRGGIPSSFSLSSFKKFALGRPYVDKINLNFYGNESDLINALLSGSIDNVNAIMPEEAKALLERGVRIKKYPLPRVYGVFFNQSQAPVLTDIAVRQALDEATDRDNIIDSVFYGFGTPLYGPVPKPNPESLSGASKSENAEERISNAIKILTDEGWEMSTSTGVMTKTVKKDTQTLSFSISTADKPELKATAGMLKENWAKIGANVEIKIFESGDLNQNVIRPRKYDSLLFGEVIGEDSDPYAFWHSSQRNDPGLNIALYANQRVDKLLEDARATIDKEERAKKYADFESELSKDVPAIFIYSPDFIYVVSSKLDGIAIGELTVPAERFLSVHKWYEDTDWVWKWLDKSTND